VNGCAVVVGATGSIGSAITKRLAAKGFTVLAVARNVESLTQLADSVPNVKTCVADIGDNTSMTAISAALQEIDMPVAMAVFAAGLPVRGSVETIDPDLLGVGANIKVGGMVRLVQAITPRLHRGSRIVAIAGSLGLEPTASEAGPGTVNAGLFNLMRQYSLLFGPRGVTTHTLSPGPTDTPRLRRIVENVAQERGTTFDEMWTEYEARNQLGRLPTVDEVAWSIEILLAPEADLLHGSVLKLDGGATHGLV
jgi:NAD(P)-dependent dehydrogenase (short-subunit alcohol dehydrogenase family)